MSSVYLSVSGELVESDEPAVPSLSWTIIRVSLCVRRCNTVILWQVRWMSLVLNLGRYLGEEGRKVSTDRGDNDPGGGHKGIQLPGRVG